MGAAVAAVIMRKQRDLVQVFQGARATSSSTARYPADIGVEEDIIFRGLVRRAVLRDVGGGRYYFDEPSWSSLRSIRRRMALVILSIVILIALVPLLITLTRKS